MKVLYTVGFLFEKDSYGVIIPILGFAISVLALTFFKLKFRKKRVPFWER